MDRTAGDIMTTEFPFVDCNATVAEAEELFEQGGVNALPVLNPDRSVFGLLLPKHLAAFHRRALNNPRAFHAWEICDARPLVGVASSDLQDVTSALLTSDARHVLIVNDDRQLIGVISTETLLENGFVEERDTAAPADRTSGGPTG